MLRYIAITLFIVAAGTIFWFNKTTTLPPIEQTRQAKPAVNDIEGNPIPPQAQQQARSHIETITPPEQTPLNVSRAQHFVTANQLLQLPLERVQTTATLESATSVTRDETPLENLDTDTGDTIDIVTVTPANTPKSATPATTQRTTPTDRITNDIPVTTGLQQPLSTVSTVPATLEITLAATITPGTDPREIIVTQGTLPVATVQTAPASTQSTAQPASTSGTPSNPLATRAEISAATLAAPVTPAKTTPAQTTPTQTTLASAADLTAQPTIAQQQTTPTVSNEQSITHVETSTPEDRALTNATLTQPAPTTLNVITITRGTAADSVTVTEQAPDIVTVRAVADAGVTVMPLTASTVAIVQSSTPSDPSQVIQQPGTTVVKKISQQALLPDSGRQIRLKELLDHPEAAQDKIFYIHAVNPNDDQGLWGIIQSALTHSFAQGIELPDSKQRIQALAHIPRLADERLQDQRSSFLGRFLQQKVEQSYTYNYQQGKIGQNPDLIKPGQQLVIVTFTEAELMQIYRYFTAQ